MELISHPNPDYPLKKHLIMTKNRALSKYNSLKLKYFNNAIIKDILKIICLSHDFGKTTTYFQKYIRNEKIEKRILKRHSEISFVLANYVIKSYLESKNIDNKYYQIFSLCIKKHHGNLSELLNDASIQDEDILKKQFDELNFNFINNILNENNFPKLNCDIEELISEVEELEYLCDDLKYEINDEMKIETYYLYQYLFSLLISSDKEDAIFRQNTELGVSNEIPSDIIDYIENKPKIKPIDHLRTEIFYKISNKVHNLDLNQKIYTLNAPTGIGKTLTIFNFALKLSNRIKTEKNIDMKIIYCLPFLSIIDQNYKVLNEVLKNPPSNILLKHHHLSDVVYWHEKNGEENILDENKSLHLMETWSSKIITTTFMQLFYSIFSNKNSDLKKFSSLSNSIIILDEIQSIPHKYWHLVNKIFRFLAEEYNIYFILTTATLPMIFDKNECVELLDDKEHYFSNLNRIKMKIHNEPMDLTEFVGVLDEDINNNPDKDFLIVLNTIKSSKEVYDLLKEYNYENTEYYYLSTNIYPKERLNRIEKINKNNKNNNRKIIVSTQLIEAGVDISVDIVYRDIAPLDSINQTAGRCNRHGEGTEQGIINIVKLINDNGHPFSRYIYNGALISKTEELLKNYDEIEERELLNINNCYFKKLKGYDDSSRELLEIIKSFKYNNVPKNFKLIDEIPQINLFVNVEDDAKKVYAEYERIKSIKDPFKRKREFLKIKKEFYQYIISIQKHAIKGKDILIDENKDITIIDNKYYNIETGFNAVEDNMLIL
ncbi:CRISPR-associated helicase Cas3 [Methanococcus aeolicus Nankai-3]|uniref:CRISPR-associated helicase Cas3 n=1 Tax=Methanococcus aeolicus (strain ATCC BAA-1280 / DSM 17508 / OCM 812 / Nankai-3) TaxID=419665 RepID=A6UVX5_META3|nr:CRISPR-associated helicase/endonuclease Cas3 [Methanococcus aeolicus]ABR56647.1 CRISPR-associated helicase Cas3 [Methanococcus aeolicus Nankai-3]